MAAVPSTSVPLLTTLTPVKRIFNEVTAASVAAPGTIYWAATPTWATFMTVYFNVTAFSTSAQLLLYELNPGIKDDSAVNYIDMGNYASTATATMVAVTATILTIMHVGPGISPTTVADAQSAKNAAGTKSRIAFDLILPQIIGFALVTVGAGTHSCTCDVAYRSAS